MPQLFNNYKQFLDLPNQSTFVPSAITEKLRRPVLTAESGAVIRMVAKFGGYVWGVGDSSNSNDGIYRSADFGENWTLMHTIGQFSILRILPCADGEILLLQGWQIQKSSGWDNDDPVACASATFSVKVAVNGAASFDRFSIDGDGTHFICGQYAGGIENWADSRYGHISEDAGDTWTIKWDTATLFPGDEDTSHIHGVCYDRWQDRYYLAEGHSDLTGIYYSDNGGTDWAKIPTTDTFFADAAPTVIVATRHGLVCGTDGRPNGLVHLRNDPSGNADDMRPEWAWKWQPTSSFSGVQGFASVGWYDEDTKRVFISFQASVQIKCPIAASDGITAGEVYAVPETGAASDKIVAFFVEGEKCWGQVLTSGGSVDQQLTGVLKRTLGARDIGTYDTGDVLGGVAYPEGLRGTLLAVGIGSRVTGLSNSAIGTSVINTAAEGSVGVGAGFTVSDSFATVVGTSVAGTGGVGSVVIGWAATNSFAGVVAIGGQVAAYGPNCTVVGRSAIGYGFDTVYGHGASCSSATQSAAFGWSATCTGANQLAVGFNAQNSGAGQFQTCVGTSSAVSAENGTALGGQTSCTHTNAIVLGHLTASTAVDTATIGGRDFEITSATKGVVLRSADASRWRLTVNDSGVLVITEI